MLRSAMTSVVNRLYGTIVISENTTLSSQLLITTSVIHQKQRYVALCMTPNVDCDWSISHPPTPPPPPTALEGNLRIEALD